jgi:hypothetical protein
MCQTIIFKYYIMDVIKKRIIIFVNIIKLVILRLVLVILF